MTQALPGRRLGARSAIAVEVVAAVSSSASGPFGKALILSGWSAGGVLLVRTCLAALLLLPPAWWAARRHGTDLRRSLGGVTVLGVLGITGTVVCYYNALARLPVGVAMMLLYLSPVLVLGWVWIRHGERPAATTCLGAVVAIGGLVLVVAAMGVQRPSLSGIGWALGGAGCVATYFLTSDRMTASVPPVVLACAGLSVASVSIGLLVAVGLLPFQAVGAAVDLGGWIVSPVLPLVLVVLLSTVFVYVAGFAAVRVLGARMTSFVALAEPIAALGSAWLLLGEVPRPLQLTGAAFVVAGVVLIRSDRPIERSSRRRPPAPDRS
ncbi:EamA family transporter [Nocardioides panacihumi]|uniref:EamA family transporter n=1 Tax=Nocardioides panacihumi TaxID=400774 RepID=A0ABP5BRZ0_9ACTN